MSLPSAQGLYHPTQEHDACGLGFVADLHGQPTHEVVQKAVQILERLAHRGAAGADPETGDGCGLLLQLPHLFYARALKKLGKKLPNAGDYGVAMLFLPREDRRRAEIIQILEQTVKELGQEILCWRDVPLNPQVLGPLGRETLPIIRQLFISRHCPLHAFPRVLFMIHRRADKLLNRGGQNDFYAASFSNKTVVYKGLMLPERLCHFYPDLKETDCLSTLALAHSRFSTNTFPTWERAHPYRTLAHNGEINTLRGNLNWMRARETNFAKTSLGKYLEDCKPVIRPQGSDSAALDNVVEFLLATGRPLPQIMMMLIPEAWMGQEDMPQELQAFYEFYGAICEPWDGPAALVFTDGELVGALLDRNGLRPAKYLLTQSGLVVVASEFGVLDLPASEIQELGRLQPGKMLLVDTLKGKLYRNDEIKKDIASKQDYATWLQENKIELQHLPETPTLQPLTPEARYQLARAFFYTREDLENILIPMALNGEEPLGSMGNDTPLSVLSLQPHLLTRYFRQQFSQVTNPPIDPIREALVMSLSNYVGGEDNLLEENPHQCRQLELPTPILTNQELARLRANPFKDFECLTLPILFRAHTDDPGESLRLALETLCQRASQAVNVGYNILILSDRECTADYAPIPAVLAVGAVHQHLIREGQRISTGLILESGEPREVHDFAVLLGYGAGAINPYLTLELIENLPVKTATTSAPQSPSKGPANYLKALNKGLLKVLSKMGISTILSYHGAQIFEALGIHHEVIDRYFTGTSSPISGLGLKEIANEALQRHASGFPREPAQILKDTAEDLPENLASSGLYAFRQNGEKHLWSPAAIAALQKAVRLPERAAFEEFKQQIDDQGQQPTTLRALLDFTRAQPPVPLAEVESSEKIVKRFVTGAMSFGSLSKEAHENLALAMNQIGGRSNSGEGGEDAERFLKDAAGKLKRSAIKQIASGRFGVTTHYLVNADELQIKMAQGAKPGEGGQLPGPKVDAIIARVRHSTPGVTLISPPPHHDIYSIEDLAQLIFDLKNVNPTARINVKLVASSGIGTIAAGVAKANAETILISGGDGGTGAAPLSSIFHAGIPWEIGLAETQQVLVANGLRSRVRLQVDGQLRTGRDIACAALLGAEEFGFATAPLIASGCVMMRKCHLNTCPVGVATQNPELRRRFRGLPEHVINYFFFVAEDLRELMASLGFRTVQEMVGRVDCLTTKSELPHAKAQTLELSKLLFIPPTPRFSKRELVSIPGSTPNLPLTLEAELKNKLLADLEAGHKRVVALDISNKDRTFGALIAGEIARKYGAQGLPPETLTFELTGTAGQSFGAFAVRGLHLQLTGAANDYVGKGLSGGILSIRPAATAPFKAADNVIVGNTVLYGATSGRAFFAGQAGERFAVRNSGALSVVEGVGDHGCEYMTGGIVIVLGRTGRNFAAGMSGGVAFVLDQAGDFAKRCDRRLVDLAVVTANSPDEQILRTLLTEHQQRTGSIQAATLLANLPAYLPLFVRVLPHEYQQVLQTHNQSYLELLDHGRN